MIGSEAPFSTRSSKDLWIRYQVKPLILDFIMSPLFRYAGGLQ